MNIVQCCPLSAQYCARLTTDCSILRYNVHGLLNIVQQCPLTAQYCAAVSTNCSILRITVHGLLNIAQYSPLTAQYCAVLSTDCSVLRSTVHDCSILRSTLHWLLNIAQYSPLTAQYCAVLSTDCSVLLSTVHWLLNIAQYCPLTAQYCAMLSTDYSISCTVFRVNQTSTVQPFSITTRRSVISPNNIIALYTWSSVTAGPKDILTELDLKPTSVRSINAAVPKLNKLQMTTVLVAAWSPQTVLDSNKSKFNSKFVKFWNDTSYLWCWDFDVISSNTVYILSFLPCRWRLYIAP
jgi:hypothetical protein